MTLAGCVRDPCSSNRLPIAIQRPTAARSWPPLAASGLAFILLLICILICPTLAMARLEVRPDSDSDSPYGTVIGIDIGTTYSRSAVYSREGTIEIIPNAARRAATPSLIHVVDGLPRVYGSSPDDVEVLPGLVISDFAFLLGRTYDDPEVQSYLQRWPFTVLERDGKPIVQVEANGTKNEFTPEALTGTMLAYLKASAEADLGWGITHVILTVPSYYNDAQRQAVKDAATLANLTTLRVVNEPEAAAIAYGLSEKSGESTALVVDLGGGALDVTLLGVDDGVFEILAASSNPDVGGREFDERLVEYAVKKYSALLGDDLTKDTVRMQRLRWTAQRAKEALSNAESTSIRVDIPGQEVAINIALSRRDFVELTKDLFRRTTEEVDKVIQEAGLTKQDIDHILLVGGSARIPYMHQLLTSHLDKASLSVPHLEPDEVVVSGAAIQAAIISGTRDMGASCILANDILPLTIGVEADDGRMAPVLIRNSVLPARKHRTFSTMTDEQTTVTVKIYEGGHERAGDNRLLETFQLTGIDPAPAGVPNILVVFEVDADGLLHVSATDTKSSSSSVTITNEKDRLSFEELEQMIQEAERSEAEAPFIPYPAPPTPTAENDSVPCNDCLATKVVDQPVQLGLGGRYIMFMMNLAESMDYVWYMVRGFFVHPAQVEDVETRDEPLGTVIREL
ncbi:Hsp70 protein-domain-containing protein [Rhodofomes roseus]|uniref:Hsp70 protein-domain-containing protein n=1 Tax=Rhodofomes roseus TaxID=34475 RepID=A0ABQ8KBT2_9APHY|nr:Hsp70 protein-domain-containing protein [Rhodofomes roseus]KAH9834446.1 Hsp70 protein-domain-containing protein [Rhodofomes roseus]